MGSYICPHPQLSIPISDYTEISHYYQDQLQSFIYKTSPGDGDWVLDKLAIWLRTNNLQFQDHLFHYKTLIPQYKQANVQWIRVSKWINSNQMNNSTVFHTPNWQFQYDNNQNKGTLSRNFMQAMLWLKTKPILLKDICKLCKNQICPEGFYRFFFYLYGGQKAKEIIIDDVIPLNRQGHYFFAAPRPRDGIWMIMIEKTLAKVVGSYSKIHSLTKQQILNEITGYPCIQIYRDDHARKSLEIAVQTKSSKYIRIICNHRMKLILCLWFPLVNGKVTQQLQKSIIVELIEDNYDKKIPIQKSPNSSPHIITYTSPQSPTGMIRIDSQKATVHLHNRTQTKVQFNFVVQSDGNDVQLTPVTANQASGIPALKQKMILKEYSERQARIQPIVFTHYKLRIIWLGHRGIFGIRNTSTSDKKFTYYIKEQFRNEIYFQDDPKDISKEGVVKPGGHAFFTVNRQKDQEYGNFYLIVCQ